jgi:hypothetical protein
MVDVNFVRDLLRAVADSLLNERLAAALSRGAAERQFVFDLASLIEQQDSQHVAIPESSGNVRAGIGNVDLLVVSRESVGYRSDGILKAPDEWPSGTLAIELKDIRLANGTAGAYGYTKVLGQLQKDVVDKAAKLPAGHGRDADWLGLTVMTDGVWVETRDKVKTRAEQTARNVRLDRWEPCPDGLLCIGSVCRSISYREWGGTVWVEAFIPEPAERHVPPRDNVWAAPPETFGEQDEEKLWWYALHGVDGTSFDGDRHAPAHLRVEPATLRDHRRDLYRRTGRWGGTFEESRLCLYTEERSWRSTADGSPFDGDRGVMQLLHELRVAWDAEGGLHQPGSHRHAADDSGTRRR